MASGFGALVSLTSATVRQAQQLLGRLPLVLVLLLTVAVKLTPDAWESRAAANILAGGAAPIVAVAVGVVGVVALIAIRLAVARFRRSEMILD
jgi:chromate transport protein ChrA